MCRESDALPGMAHLPPSADENVFDLADLKCSADSNCDDSATLYQAYWVSAIRSPSLNKIMENKKMSYHNVNF